MTTGERHRATERICVARLGGVVQDAKRLLITERCDFRTTLRHFVLRSVADPLDRHPVLQSQQVLE